MRWEEAVVVLFDDLEQQAAGLHAEARAGEVRDLAEAGYAEVRLESRVHASLGAAVRVGLLDGTDVRGRLVRAGAGWMLLDAGTSEWLVRLAAVGLVEGLEVSSVPDPVLPLTARLGVGSALRRAARAGSGCSVRLVGGSHLAGSLGRVGADFVELETPAGVRVVPLAAVAALSSGRSG